MKNEKKDLDKQYLTTKVKQDKKIQPKFKDCLQRTQ